MFVRSLELHDFRSWRELSLPLDPGVTVFSGPNGHGKTNIVEALLNAHAALDDAGVPMENRVTFIRSDYAVKYKLADEFKYEGAKEFIQKRQIGEVEGSPLIKVPKNRFPAGVAFMRSQ